MFFLFSFFFEVKQDFKKHLKHTLKVFLFHNQSITDFVGGTVCEGFQFCSSLQGIGNESFRVLQLWEHTALHLAEVDAILQKNFLS